MTNQRSLPYTTSLGLVIWSFLTLWILRPLVMMLGVFRPKLATQVTRRQQTRDFLEGLRSLRQRHQSAALCFCSSAGEYEQAKPVIERLTSRGTLVHVVFFSHSGARYLTSRSDNQSWQLAPIDNVASWRALYTALQPQLTIVVRHEFWPAFLAVAWQKSYVTLIDASRSQDHYLYRLFMRKLTCWFDTIYCIDASDVEFFRSLGVSNHQRILSTGDTKFDRAVERAQRNSDAVLAMRTSLVTSFGELKRFIIGSAWPIDVDVALDAYKALPIAIRMQWQVIIVPHEVGNSMVEVMQRMIQSKHLTSTTASKLSSLPSPRADTTTGEPIILIVDQLGKLAEMYGCAELAMVGGAMHHQVHNVIEPASYGLPIAFGPRYQSQREAIMFAQEGLATVVHNGDELATWWLESISNPRGDATSSHLLRFTGASDLIIQEIERVFP